MEKIKILYLDDEVNNLNSFKATFRYDYQILIAQSADEGMRIVEQHPDLTIIFCDQRMPDKTGVDFFREVSLKYPDPIRMLVTGYIDLGSVIDAINDGHIYRYIAKPWREEEVRSAIDEGYKYYTTSSMLRIKNQELQEANAELDKFSYSVTHDIRGPVVSILGALQILKNMDDLQEIKELVAMMEQSAEKVKDFITNIHAYYNLKRGDLNLQDLNLRDMVEELLILHQVELKVQNIEVKQSIDQNESFRSDLAVMQLIINNLLTNSIKYQRKLADNKFIGIQIEVKDAHVHMVIEDNGIGIDTQYLDGIFDMFFRATHENIGSGFGLYYVKDAVQKLKGQIQVESVVNQGTKFFLTIPSH